MRKQAAVWCTVAMAAVGCSGGTPGQSESARSAAARVAAPEAGAPGASAEPAWPGAASDPGAAVSSGFRTDVAPLAPPAGWMAWSLAPRGCTVWIPESRAQLEQLGELEWRACPFQATGCAALGAPWARRTGWGFGGRLGAVAAGERTYLTVTRQIEEGTWETLILAGATALRPVAAWRQRLPEAGCVLGAVSLTAEPQGGAAGGVSAVGAVRAALPIMRADDETAPLIVLGAPESLSSRPEVAARTAMAALPALTARDGAEPRDGTSRVETFGAPGAEVLARDVAIHRGELLVVWEHEDRFALRDLTSGRTTRPVPVPAKTSAGAAGGGATGTARAGASRSYPTSPPAGEPTYRALLEATPVGDAVLFGAWTGDHGSVWAADRGGRTTPLLAEPRASFDRFATDGVQAVWLRSTGLRAPGTFDRVELWTGRVERGALVEPRRVRSLGGRVLPLVSLGEGWAALWGSGEDVLLVRLADGELRRLPAVPQLSWDGGSGGLAIASGAVWARASLRGGAGNDYRLLARFALEALPKGSLR